MSSATDNRPNPDTLLAKVQAEETRAARGKLRIYFGSCAGVGKTYAMLEAARNLRAEGRDVVVGIVETHGRTETAALMKNLEVLPLRMVDYRGTRLTEFDLDAALARRPSLMLVDELAHSNAPESRHPKRWHDVEELLEAGIDVFTTLNVQHLESLNDVVGGITNIRIWETVPDTVFDAADEVVLVDITADELLARLKAGKVYLPEQAERAASHFFRKGNLIALREIALRRTADRVEDEVQAYRVHWAIAPVWKTEAALLVCIGPDVVDERLVRSAARLASQLNVAWYAIYVETPALQRLPPTQRERILRTLKLAERLDATTAVLAGSDVAESVAEHARNRNVSRVVIGRAAHRRVWPWQKTLAQQIARLAPEIDLVEIGRIEGETAPAGKPVSLTPDRETGVRRRSKRYRYLFASLACMMTTLLAAPLLPYFDQANIVMLFLLTVVFVAVRWGRGPAVFASCMSVVSFDFFFVPPRFTFAVGDVQYLVTFAVMLAVGLTTAHMTAGLRFQARVASHRDERSRTLYEFARALSSALQAEQIVTVSDEFVERTFRADLTLLLPDASGKLVWTPTDAEALNVELGTAQWAFDKNQPAGFGTDTLPGTDTLYLPLRAPMCTRGVLAIKPRHRRLLMIPEQRQYLDTFATLIAIALERVHYVEVAQEALVRMESERLRNSLLSALSHDLRTPLTVLLGLAESLALTKPALSPQQAEMTGAIREEAHRMTTLVSNLLDMARIESGAITLNLQWQLFEEVVGSALNATKATLLKHKVKVQLAPDLPLVRFDAALIERVLVNLLENAAKYTPEGSTVWLTARVAEGAFEVTVSDNGPGLPRGREELMFEKFMRGERESATTGVGLGLAICRAIVQAHRGKMWAANRSETGARFTFILPIETPPDAMYAADLDIHARANANG